METIKPWTVRITGFSYELDGCLAKTFFFEGRPSEANNAVTALERLRHLYHVEVFVASRNDGVWVSSNWNELQELAESDAPLS